MFLDFRQGLTRAYDSFLLAWLKLSGVVRLVDLRMGLRVSSCLSWADVFGSVAKP